MTGSALWGHRRAAAAASLACTLIALLSCGDNEFSGPKPPDPALVVAGKDIFRFNTFGDESFWTDTLRIHEVIQSAVDPTTALSVGLKVDAEALPAEVVQGIQTGQHQPHRSGDHGGAAQAQRSGRGQRDGEHGQWQRHADRGRHHLCPLSFDGQ